jgi:hypothetical protein
MDTATIPPPVGLRELDSASEKTKQSELLLDALKAALAASGEHRLFRWGKLSGLFPSRVGPSAAAAQRAIREGLLESTRTETRGKLVVEWVRATSRAVDYLHENDSPAAVLRELRDVIGTTRQGVPIWMTQARDEAAQLSLRFVHFSREMLKRLDDLSERVETALRKVDHPTPTLRGALPELVPWAQDALEFLDKLAVGGTSWSRLNDLFHAMKDEHPELSVPEFHQGIRRLHEGGHVKLTPPADPEAIREPEYAVEIRGQMMWVIGR